MGDAGSTNGTSVNGAVVEGGQVRELENGDRVRFGGMQFTFYTPEGFYELLSVG